MTARLWVIRSTGRRPLTVNAVAGMHRMAWANHTRDARGEWWALALDAGVQRVRAATIVATPLHRDRRSPQDVAACAPEVKAAVDGLIDAGLLVDDGPAHLLAIEFLPPSVCGVDGLELVVAEILDPVAA